jgi:hypothetical protein
MPSDFSNGDGMYRRLDVAPGGNRPTFIGLGSFRLSSSTLLVEHAGGGDGLARY